MLPEPVLRPVERSSTGSWASTDDEQGWKGYTISVLVLALVAIVAMYIVIRLQDVLPLNQGGTADDAGLAFNTSVSFETNTNWQNYSGESGASHLTQAAGLAVRNFTSAAPGSRRDRARPRPHPPQPPPSATTGSTSPAARCTSCCRSRSSAPSCSSGRAFPRLQPARRDHAPGRAADTSRSARSRPRNGSRSWATTAAAPSTPTRPIRSRTPRR